MNLRMKLSAALLLALVPMFGCDGCESTGCARNSDCNPLFSNDEVCHSGQCLPRECGRALELFECGLFSGETCDNGRCIGRGGVIPPDPNDGIPDTTEPEPEDPDPEDMGDPDPNLSTCTTPAPQICEPARATEWPAATIDSPRGVPAGPPACEPGAWWTAESNVAEFRLVSTDGRAAGDETSVSLWDALSVAGPGTRVVSLAPQTFGVLDFAVAADETLVLVSPCWGDTVLELDGRIVVSDGGTLVLSGVSLQHAGSEPAIVVETGGALSVRYSAMSGSGPIIEAEEGSRISIHASSIESDAVALDLSGAEAWVSQTRFGSGSPISIRGTGAAWSARLTLVNSVFELFGAAVGIDAEQAAVAIVDTRISATDGDETGFTLLESVIGIADSEIVGGRAGMLMVDSRAFVSDSDFTNAGWGITATSRAAAFAPDDHNSLFHFPASQFGEPPLIEAEARFTPTSVERPTFATRLEEAASLAFPARAEIAATADVELLSAPDVWPALYVLDSSVIRSNAMSGLQVSGGLTVLEDSAIQYNGGLFQAGDVPDQRNAHGAYLTDTYAVFVRNTNFNNNTGTGLYVDGSAEPVRVNDSGFRINALGGMWAGDAPLIEVYRASFEGNALFGLSTWNSPLRVDSSLFTANAPFTYAPLFAGSLGDGILVAGAPEVAVFDSEIRNHTQYGLYAHDVSLLTLDGNMWAGNLLDNGAAGIDISDVGISGAAPQTQGADPALSRILAAPERVPARDAVAPAFP